MEMGKLVARTFLQVALDGVDLAARVMASTETMHRYSSRFQSLGVLQEFQQTIQNLSFEGSYPLLLADW